MKIKIKKKSRPKAMDYFDVDAEEIPDDIKGKGKSN